MILTLKYILLEFLYVEDSLALTRRSDHESIDKNQIRVKEDMVKDTSILLDSDTTFLFLESFYVCKGLYLKNCLIY